MKSESSKRWDVCVVGAGAAGLMAGIWARRAAPGQRVLLLDGSKNLGAKILISGGGRCNVTHEHVDESSFSGSTPMAIRKVLRRFGVVACTAFFREMGVELVREDTGKLFPREGRARGVLEALLREAAHRGVVLSHPRRVDRIAPYALPAPGSAPEPDPRTEEPSLSRNHTASGFVVSGAWGRLVANRVIVATGGRSVPKTGSDGSGFDLLRQLGHSITPLLPALVPLTLPPDHFLCTLRGIAVPVELELRSGSGKKRCVMHGPLLCTHFGISGPVVLDMSRHYLQAQREDEKSTILVRWLPGRSPEELDQELQALQSGSIGAFLARALPERLARALCQEAGVDPGRRLNEIRRTHRTALVRNLTALPLPITGSRGFAVAEVTAGGVPLAELRLETLESRLQPGLFLCGEVCDVDGRIGGFNFHWAWASGFTAGHGAASV